MQRLLLLLATLLATGTAGAQEAADAKLPNVVIVYADDLGYGDLSCYNAEAAYQTPRLDQMAAEGVRFTDAHSPSTICSPSRAGLYAGQLICRNGRRSTAFEGPSGPSYLHPGQLTIADMMQSRGYRTAVFGKWHVGLTWFDKEGKRLGGGFDNSLLIDYERSTPLIDGPNARGFDVSFVTPNCPTTDPLYLYIEDGMVPVPASLRHKRDTLPNPGGKWRWDNDEGWMAPGYRFEDADVLFFERTEAFLREHVKERRDQPFFTVLSTQIAHAPVLPAEGFEGTSGAGPRGDFVLELDALTGRLLDLLDELGVGDDTLVLFNADNGPETVHTDWMRRDHGHDAAGGLRGMKRDGWEGGHRVPFLARWPKRIPAGAVSSQLTNTTDLFATLASVVGAELDDDVAVDSFDMLPALVGLAPEGESIRPYMLTQSFRGEFQLRAGDWKYLAHTGSGGNRYDRGALQEYALAESAPGATAQLYDLSADPGETKNLFFENAEKREELAALLARLTEKEGGRTAPRGREPLGVEALPKVAAADVGTAPASAPAPAKRPNFLFVLADDQSPFDFRTYDPGSRLDAPVIERLAANGITLDAAYHMGSWSGAVCTPSRHMIMSGRSVWHLPRNGVKGAGPNPLCPEDLPAHTLGAVFGAAGYDTMRTCKKGNSYAAANAQFQVVRDQTSRQASTEKGSAWHAEQVLSFLDERAATEDSDPFFVYFGFSHPHDPRWANDALLQKYGATNEGPIPAQGDATPPLPNNWLPSHPFPDGHPGLRDEVKVQGVMKRRDPATMRNEMGRQFACSENIDTQLGRVLARLEAMGELDNTFVVYTADHGMAIGRHGLQGKQNLYEHTWRVPLIVQGPGIAAGTRAPGNVYLMDVLATLCELGGVEAPESNEGTSFAPVLRGEKEVVRDVMYGAYSGGTKPGMRCVRRGKWKLIEYDVMDGAVRETQLFDLEANPDELLLNHHVATVGAQLRTQSGTQSGAAPMPEQRNLASDPEHAETLAEMRALLRAEMVRLDDPYRLWNQSE